MAVPPFQPPRESQLLAWSDNFSTLITATPTAFGLSAPQAVAYAALHATWASAYEAATNPATNAHANIVAKNTAKQNLLNGPGGAKQLVDIVQAFPGTTDEMRATLNVKIRDVDPTPVPVPSEAPEIDVLSTLGHSIKVRLHGAGKTGKPANVKGASVFTYVGATAPADLDAWTFQENTTKNVVDLEVASSTAPGSLVWITAFWLNSRMDSGPATTPISTNIPGGLSVAA